MRLRLGLGLLVVLALLAANSRAAWSDQCDAPKPDFKPTQAGVTAAAQSFAGVWAGTWSLDIRLGRTKTRDSLCTRLYVAPVDNNTARVTYCAGSVATLGRQPVCYSINATLDGASLRFVEGADNELTFTHAGTNTLGAQMNVRGDRTYQTEFAKQE